MYSETYDIQSPAPGMAAVQEFRTDLALDLGSLPGHVSSAGYGSRLCGRFPPIIMAYSAIYSAKQTGEAVNAGTEDFLLPVPLRDVLWAKYLFAFLMGSASAVVVLAAVLFQTLLNPEEAHQPLLCAGCHHDLHRSHHRSRHAAALPVRRHQGTLHPAGAHGNFGRSGRQRGSGGPAALAACPIRSALP